MRCRFCFMQNLPSTELAISISTNCSRAYFENRANNTCLHALMQVRDRQSMLFFCSRSARTVHKPQGIIAKACRNDFRICLKTDHALDLLRFTFRPKKSAFRPKKKLSHRIRSLITPAELSTKQLPDFQRFIDRLREFKLGTATAVIGHCVVVDLCRPFVCSLHLISIYNANKRSHSNVPKDSKMFQTFDGSDLSDGDLTNIANEHKSTEWCPRPPPEQSIDGPDFVMLTRTTWPQTRPLCVEGVAVKASAPVAIRVELQNMSGQWISVDGGALLRPDKNANNLVSQPKRHKCLQLIIFRDPYVNFSLQSARITVVECNGRSVRVGLLVSNTKTLDQALSRTLQRQSYKSFLTTDNSTDILTGRTEGFDNGDDYYNWWYRLQSVRARVGRLSPHMHEAVQDMKKDEIQLSFSRSRISAVSKTPCCGRHDSKIMMPSILVYGVSMIVAFPVMLGMNLDQACALHSWNTTNATNITTNISMTTTSHYNMVSPDPNRIMRTMCWRRDTHMDKPALVVP